MMLDSDLTCENCESSFTISFDQENVSALAPKYCPFCGHGSIGEDYHDDEDEELEFDDDDDDDDKRWH